MDIDILKDYATLLVAVLGLATLIVAVTEYRRDSATKRADHFLEMRKRLKENKAFKTIAELIEVDDAELAEIPFPEKRDYLGLFEEVAISMNSGLIRRHVAHYMFGYYAIRCWESKYFWVDVNRDSLYWAVFGDFVRQMKEVERGFEYKRRHFTF